MIQPVELKLDLPMTVANGTVSNTSTVWQTLHAAHHGDLSTLQLLIKQCPDLAYGQYNYTPPIHLAVREGHGSVVQYLLELGAYDPSYRTYPFRDSLLIIAQERGLTDIADMLFAYERDPSRQKFRGDNGEIHYDRTPAEQEFQNAVEHYDLETTENLLTNNPGFASDETYFWSEGIMLFAAKENNRQMIDLLMKYGARVPKVLKWTQFYYFEHQETPEYLLERGMDPNTMSWHHVTILHDMAQKGNKKNADLLLTYGADINAVDEEYQSTPLGLAARWGQAEMVDFLLSAGADPSRSGAVWSTPIEWARKKGYSEIVTILLKAIG